MWLYSFNSSALEMFAFKDAILGVDTTRWESSIHKLNKKSEGISDKINAIKFLNNIDKERNQYIRIHQKRRELGISTPKHHSIMAQINKRKKPGKKILNKRI